MWNVLFICLFSCKQQPPKLPARSQMVAYDPLSDASYADSVKSILPEAQIDAKLQKATQTLIAATRDPLQPMSVKSMIDAEKVSGYPSQAHFLKVMNAGAFPSSYLSHLSQHGKIDLGISKRSFADGRVLWVIGWGKHVLDIDPVPLTLPLDGVFPLRIGEFDADRAILYLSPPDQPVERIELIQGTHRWMLDFHVPGEYRFEVLLQDVNGAEHHNEIALLFSVFVDTELPNITSTAVHLTPPNPIVAEQQLFQAVNDLRRERQLPPLKPFPLFVPLAREHSALMASTRMVQHRIVGVTNGVPEKAGKLAHPKANHFQNVAAALTAEEALTLAKDSPGHFQVFLCETCTHMSIGAALEPTLAPNPRLYVTWEVLEFPRGTPQPIDKLNRDF